MSPDELNVIERQSQTLLGQLKAAEAALREGLHTHGFGSAVRAHMERALAHVNEACVAINEPGHVRSVHQLVEDLNRMQRVMDGLQRQQRKSIRV